MNQSDPDRPNSAIVSITVLSVTPARAKKLFAFASVEIDVEGMQIGIYGIRVAYVGKEAVAIELPKFRDADGRWRTAITLPEEIYAPLARAVLDELIACGLTLPSGSAAPDSHHIGHLAVTATKEADSGYRCPEGVSGG